MAEEKKKKQKKAAKHKAKRNQQKKKSRLKALNRRTPPENLVEQVDAALEIAEKGNLSKAGKMIDKLKNKYPDTATVYYGKGILALHEEKWEEAIWFFNAAVEINPSYIEAYYNLAVAYKGVINFKGMAVSLEKVIELYREDPELADHAKEMLDELRTAFESSGDVTLEEMIEAQTYFDEAFKHMQLLDFVTAVELFKKAISINPEPPQAYGNLGICYGSLGEKESALIYFDMALEIDPNYELARVNRELVERLEQGERLSFDQLLATDYYLDLREQKD